MSLILWVGGLFILVVILMLLGGWRPGQYSDPREDFEGVIGVGEAVTHPLPDVTKRG